MTDTSTTQTTRTHTYARTAFALIIAMGVLLPAAVGPAAAAEQADLQIDQPSYVDTNVQIDESGEQRIYKVRGNEYRIRLNGVDHENVSAVNVVNGPGSIEYDEGIDAWRFSPNGNAGTSTLRFQVEIAGGVVTQEAILQTSDVNWVHRTSKEDKKITAAANKWETVKQKAADVDPDAETMAIVNLGMTAAKFIKSPFEAYVNDIQAALIILFFRPGGWTVLAILIGIALFGVASGARYKNRTQKQLADWGDIQTEKDEAYLQKARKVASEWDWNDLFPDDVARAHRDYFGRNCWTGLKSYMLMRSDTSIKGTVLQMMGQLEYEGWIKRNEDGTIIDAGTTQGESPRGDGGDVETIQLGKLDHEDERDRAFIEAVGIEDIDDTVFDVDPERIDLSKAQFAISNREVDDAELFRYINPDFPEDYEGEPELCEILGKFFEWVIEHPATDDVGRIEPTHDLISYHAEMSSILADDLDIPIGMWYRREMFWLADRLTADAELAETIERVDMSGAGGDAVPGGD